MILIDDKLISEELFENQFICNLGCCLGACCVQGDSGAPLEENEARILETESDRIADFISEEGVIAIGKEGPWIRDVDGDIVTPLINGKECAYTVFEDGIAKCGIEIAFFKKATTFRKPVSCHLYPIRVSSVGEYTALNYHRWPICDPARELGKKEGVPVFRFLKEAIVRVWGADFYEEMEKIYRELVKTKMPDKN